jgi:NhaC family Na+:H+ antiporter
MKSEDRKIPSFAMAVFPIIAMCAILGIGFGVYRYSVEVLLLISACVAGICGLLTGTGWKQMMDEIQKKVGQSFGAFSIIIIVGMLIGTWMLSGTIPMLIYYGLQLLNPSLFLVTAFILTAIVSVCTGTSFGSAGTIGLALIGIAHGLGINMGAAAGAIISGAYFGDKMSPLSDTTNLAPVAAGSELFEHIHHMFYTTIPATIVCLIVYFLAGQSQSVVAGADISAMNDLLSGLSTLFHFHILLLLPIVIVLVGSVKGMPTIPIMILASVVAGVEAVIFQGNTLGQIITACFSGFNVEAMGGVDASAIPASVVSLVQRGGMNGMMTTILRILCSFAFAGIMDACGFMEAILIKLRTLIRSTGSLILVTAISGVVMSLIIGNAYVPILMVGDMFKESYKERGLAAKNLSRTLEDSITVIIPLAPWTAGGAYMSSTLGVDTFTYAPWAVLCYTCVIFAVINGFTGFGIAKLPGSAEVSGKLARQK